MMSEKVIVEKVDERFTERFKELYDLRSNFREGVKEIRQQEELQKSKLIVVWDDLKKRYELENMVEFKFCPSKKQILSPQGKIIVEKVDDKFVERFNEILKSRERLESDISFVMNLKEVLEAKECILFTEVTSFYHLEGQDKDGILQYNGYKNQIVLVDKESWEEAQENIKNFLKRFLDDLGR